MLVRGDVDYEIRTTLYPDIITPDRLDEMINFLSNLGVENYVIQKYRSRNRVAVDMDKYSNIINNSVGKFNKLIVR